MFVLLKAQSTHQDQILWETHQLIISQPIRLSVRPIALGILFAETRYSTMMIRHNQLYVDIVDIGSGNGLMSSDNKPLPEPALTNGDIALRPQRNLSTPRLAKPLKLH